MADGEANDDDGCVDVEMRVWKLMERRLLGCLDCKRQTSDGATRPVVAAVVWLIGRQDVRSVQVVQVANVPLTMGVQRKKHKFSTSRRLMLRRESWKTRLVSSRAG